MRADTRIPRLSKVLYREDSREAKALHTLPFRLCQGAVEFGEDVFHAALPSLVDRAKTEGPGLVSGLVLGFHGKAIDQLIAIQALTHGGSLGPAIGATRTLFELFLYHRFLLEDHTHSRAEAYRRWSVLEELRHSKELRTAGDLSEELATNIAMLQGIAAEWHKEPRRGHWTNRNMASLSKHLKLETLYLTFYKLACQVTHGADADYYNPILVLAVEREPSLLKEPHFMSNYGRWRAADAFALAFLVNWIPWSLFGRTASYMEVELPAEKRERCELAERAIADGTLQPSASFDLLVATYPSLFEDVSEEK